MEKLLQHITFVDTPGVLSGEKQRTQRSYDFTGVTSWFAAKCDLILLLFDPHKLDISDEFKRVIGSLRGHDDKIRVVLNKADQVDTQQVWTKNEFFACSLSFATDIEFTISSHCSLCVYMEHWCGPWGKFWILPRLIVFTLGMVFRLRICYLVLSLFMLLPIEIIRLILFLVWTVFVMLDIKLKNSHILPYACLLLLVIEKFTLRNVGICWHLLSSADVFKLL